MAFDIMGTLGSLGGGAIEEYMRDNAAESAQALARGMMSLPHAADELPCLSIVLSAEGPLAVVGVTELDGTPKRDITYFKVEDLLRTIPIAAWMKASKELKKEQERIEKQRARINPLDTMAMAELEQRAGALLARMSTAYQWPGITDAPAFQQAAQRALPAPPTLLPEHADNEQLTTTTDAADATAAP